MEVWTESIPARDQHHLSMRNKKRIRTTILNTIAALAALSLAACGKPSDSAAGVSAGGSSGVSAPVPAKTPAPAAKPKPAANSAVGRFGISDAQQRKIAEIGKIIPRKQIVMEEPDQGVTYYVYVFEDGKYSATITHRFFGKSYAGRFDSESDRVSSYIVEKDKSLLWFSTKNSNYKYDGKTYDEVYANRKEWVKQESGGSFSSMAPRLVE